MEDYNFALFYAIWASMCKWKIPEVHMQIVNYLEDEDWLNDTKVLLIFRGVGKSTLVDLWVAYKLSKNPALRFLILAQTHTYAKKGSQDILSIIRRHPLCEHLISDTLETRKDSFFVRGCSDHRNPSVTAQGIGSSVTGGRADYIICDDVEVKENSGSEGKRQDLRTRLSETTHLLVPEIINEKVPGRRLFIGTYHDEVSIYDEQVADGASLLRIPLLSNISGEYPYIVGDTAWKERFPDNIVATKQKMCRGKAEFYSQYLLIPSSIEDSALDPSLVKIYTDEVVIKEVNNTTIAKIGDYVIKSVSAWWDPAMSGKDDSVLSVVYTSAEGRIFVHRTILLMGTDPNQQCEQIKRTALKLGLPIIKIETNGIGNFLPEVLRGHVKELGIGVEGVHSSQNKNQKIMENLETPLYGGFLHVHQSVADGKFLIQMRDFNPSTTKQKDDYIDSVASAIKEEPIRIAGVPGLVKNSINMSWIGEGCHEIERDSFTF